MRTRLINFVSVLVLGAFSASSASAAPELPIRTSTQAAVTVAVTPRTFSGAVWEFELTFNTHSGALNDDIEKATTLTTDLGKTFSPVKWQGSPTGGHHRNGVLQFKPISPLPASIEIRITREGEAQPRSFKWQLKGP
ncbi:MAG: hypothetical protein WBJ19_01120 [Rhodoferax sp.]